MEDIQHQNLRLIKENEELKKQLQKLKSRYQKLKQLYVASVKKTIEAELKLKEFNIMTKIATNFAAYFNEAESEDEDIDLKQPPFLPTIQNSKVIPFIPHDQPNSQRIFQQFAIIQPNLTSKEFQTAYIYPNQNLNDLEHIRKRLFTFIFPNGVNFREFQDDAEESRKNQIIFGSQGELLEFVLENDNEENSNHILESTNRKRKYYCYILVKPHIIMSQPKYISSASRKLIESERAFVFISKFPFMDFFTDLNKSIQQTVKLLHLSDKPMDSIRKDYNIINKILKKIFDTRIQYFPIDKSWKTEISEVKLNIESEHSLMMNQRKHFFNCIANQFPPVIISKLIHYILIESHLFFFCSNRELLNDTIGFVKSIIYPLMWEFSTIYSLNNELLPFLEAPFPIIIGANKKRHEIQQAQWGLQNFVVFDIEQEVFINDEKPEKIILNSWKKLAIDLNKEKPSGMLQVVEQFINGLIRTSKEEQSPTRKTEFHKELMQTQMMTTYLGV